MTKFVFDLQRFDNLKVTAVNKIFSVDSIETTDFYDETTLLATGAMDSSNRYVITPINSPDLSEYTFEIGENFPDYYTYSDTSEKYKLIITDKDKLKENTSTKLKTETAGQFSINNLLFYATTPLELFCKQGLAVEHTGLKSGTLKFSGTNRKCYTYAESNFKTFNMDVLNFHFKNSAEVDVTFENGEITEIKNLDAGESVNLVSYLTNNPGNKKRNFYYFNGENLFVGEYEKNNNGWQFKPGVKVYKNYSPEKNILNTENLTEITGEEINFGKADYLVAYWNDPVTHTMTFDLTGLKKNTIFVTTINNDYCNFVGTFINGELTCRYDTTKEIIKNLPEGETVKFKGLTYKRENGKIFVEKNNSIEIYSYEDDLDLLSLDNTSANYLTKLSGVKNNFSSDDYEMNDTTIILKNSALNGKNISVEGDYTLELPSGTPSPQYYGASWSVSNGTIKYNSASNSAGYSLSGDKKSVTYTSATSSQNLLTITGLKNSATQNDFSVSGNVVTLKKSALDGKNISVTGNYTIAIANDVEIPTITKKAGWTVSKGTAKYFSESISGGYNLSSDKKSLTYTNKIDGKVLATVTGLKKSAKTSDFSLKNNIITLKKSALGKKNISVTGNYTLALAKNISKPKTTKAGWTISETNATYKNKKISAGYTLSKNKKSVSYTKESGGETLVTLSGLKSGVKAKNLSLKKKTVTISKNAIGTDLITVKGDGYKFILKSSGNLKNIGKTANLQGSSGNDTLIGGTGKDTLNGGKGDDILTGGKGKDIFIFSEGNDTITDYTAGQDKIKISSGKISKTTVNGKDVIFTIGKGSITVKNGKDKKITIENSSGKTSTKTYSKNISELWFAEENNFVTSDNLSEITKTDFNPTTFEKISETNFDNLTQENFVTYSEK